MFCQTKIKVHPFFDGQSSLILKVPDDKAKQLETKPKVHTVHKWKWKKRWLLHSVWDKYQVLHGQPTLKLNQNKNEKYQITLKSWFPILFLKKKCGRGIPGALGEMADSRVGGRKYTSKHTKA